MKQHAIRTVYAVHHSHTDIGYTDLQEHVIDLQTDYIRSYELARRLDPELDKKDGALVRDTEDSLLLYAEHTWGHSASITNPYESMVLDLDMRKNGYASRAHEGAARPARLHGGERSLRRGAQAV